MNKKEIKSILFELKNSSGTHSPSISTIQDKIKDFHVEIDGCFLSNPYATNLFMDNFNKDLIKTGKIRDLLEFYPPQNQVVSKSLEKVLNIPSKNIFVGNGAIEIIQAVIHKFVKRKICVIIPTFSSYYEFVENDKELIYYHLQKDNDYKLDAEDYVKFIKQNKPDTIVIINPNNPNGAYLSNQDFHYLLSELSFVENIIIDESFIHFAYDDDNLDLLSSENLVLENKNLIIIKSMSKDFGIAGLRAGYAIMNENRVLSLLKNGFLWNVSGLTDYFFRLYSQNKFISDYEKIRKKYIVHTNHFFNELKSINEINVLPSKANFALIELNHGMSSSDFFIDLLVDHKIYVRDCSDKIGLDGEYVRIASRSFDENEIIINSIRKMF